MRVELEVPDDVELHYIFFARPADLRLQGFDKASPRFVVGLVSARHLPYYGSLPTLGGATLQEALDVAVTSVREKLARGEPSVSHYGKGASKPYAGLTLDDI